MKAVILAGGYGKRLMPLTSSIPKPLLQVGGKPIIDWQISWLRRSGISSFIVTCGYLKDKIISHLEALHRKSDIEIEYAVEKTPLGTGGGLRNARKYVQEEEFIAVNGDVITNINLKLLKLGRATTTMALTPLKSTFGIVKTSNGTVRSFEEKPYIHGYWINAGAYLMGPDIFEYLPSKGNIEQTAFAVLAERGLLRSFKYKNVYWHSIDSIKDIEETDRDLKKGIL